MNSAHVVLSSSFPKCSYHPSSNVKPFPSSLHTSVSDAVLDVSEEASAPPSAAESVVKLVARELVGKPLSSRGEIPLGWGELEGVGPGEGLGERFPISMAKSSVQGRPWLRRKSSVSLSTTSSLVR